MNRIQPLVCCFALAICASITLAEELINGDFENGLVGWHAVGDVSVNITEGNDVAVIQENTGGTTSRLFQVFDLPADAQTLQFRYLLFSFRSASPLPLWLIDDPNGIDAKQATNFAKGSPAITLPAPYYRNSDWVPKVRNTKPTLGSTLNLPPDSFSAFLLDPQTLERLLPPPGEPPEGFDDFFHADHEGLIDFNSDYVSLAGPDDEGVYTVILDVSTFTQTIPVHLEFGVAGFANGWHTAAFVDDVMITLGNATPVANCRNATLQVDEFCCVLVGVEDVDNGSFDPDGLDDVASLCITQVDGQDVDCTQDVQVCDSGEHTITLTITDMQSESSSCSATVTLDDTTIPLLTCPQDATFECTGPAGVPVEEVPLEAKVSDNCDQSIDVLDDRPVDTYPTTCDPNDATIVTFSAMDDAGNLAECTTSIAAVDTTAPSLTGPPDRMISCEGSTDPADTGAASANDLCDSAVEVDYADTVLLGECPHQWTILRLWSAGDACGNTASTQQTIEVSDWSAPQLSVPQDIVIECDDPSTPEATGYATAQDNCDDEPFINYEDQIVPGDCPQSLTIVRHWSASDACGNGETEMQAITVIDNEAPILTCLDTVTVQCTSPNGIPVDEVPLPVTVIDNCDPDVELTDDRPEDFYSIGTTSVTFTASDDCGLSDQCVVNVVTEGGCEEPQLDLDVYPGIFPNVVVLNRNYTIYVAVYGGLNFDPTTIDVDTVRFGPTGTEASPVIPPYLFDIDEDGHTDALFGFRTFDCAFSLEDVLATIKLSLLDNTPLSGQDAIEVVP